MPEAVFAYERLEDVRDAVYLDIASLWIEGARRIVSMPDPLTTLRRYEQATRKFEHMIENSICPFIGEPHDSSYMSILLRERDKIRDGFKDLFSEVSK